MTQRADELLRKHLPAMRWLVPELLPEGLTLLAGKPKQGKSWLALQLACAVASGQPFLARSVQAREVLYLALEDHERRLRTRLEHLVGEASAPRGLHLGTTCPPLERGGLEGLADWLKVEHPEVALVIIDTLAKVRAAPRSGASLYHEDYAALSGLLQLAHAEQRAVLVVHHVNKRQGVGDPLDTVSGSTGLTGAADATWLLTRPRGQAHAQLRAVGRDLEERVIPLTFDLATGPWSCHPSDAPVDALSLTPMGASSLSLGCSATGAPAPDQERQRRAWTEPRKLPAVRSPKRQAILRVLEAAYPAVLRPQEISQQTGQAERAVGPVVWQLARAGLIARRAHGLYAALPQSSTIA